MTARIHNSKGTWKSMANAGSPRPAVANPSTRINAANPASFGTNASIAAEPVPVPSYTSGA